MSNLTRHHTRLLVPSVLVALVALLTSALGTAAATPRHAADGAVYGGTVRVAFSEDFATLDPAGASGIDQVTMYGTLFNGLYRFDGAGHPQIDLAAAPPTISADGKTWTFKIRKGVLFSNGMEVTADDFRYSIMRVLDPHLKPVSPDQTVDNIFVGSQTYISGTATDVSGIQVLDRYTIRFVLTQPTAVLPYLLAETYNYVIPKAVVSKETPAQVSDHPIGTGPFMLSSWQKGTQAIFVRNPRYFHKGRPYLDKVIVYLNVRPNLIALKVQIGQLDGFAADFEIAAADLQQMRSDPKYKSYLVEVQPSISIWLDLNASDPIFKSLPLRQAVAMAIDRQRLVQLDGGDAIPLSQTYLPTFTQFDAALAHRAVYPYDPQKAAALVKASGYHGQPLIYLDRAGVPYLQAIAPGIQQDLKQIGLNVTIKVVGRLPYHVIREQLTGHQLNSFDWGIDYADAWDLYSFTMACNQNGNGGFSGSHYCDPKADALTNKAETLQLGPARDMLFRQAQMRILQSATKVPLMYAKATEIVSPRIGGFNYQPATGWQYEFYWIKK